MFWAFQQAKLKSVRGSSPLTPPSGVREVHVVLGCIDISVEVYPSAGEGYGGLVGSSVFAVSGGESAKLLEPAEASLDSVAQLVESSIVRALHLAADFGRDDGFRADALDGSDDGVGVIAAISHDDLGLATGKQRQRFGELPGLTAGQPKADRLAQAVGQQVNLGAQSTSGTPQSLVFAPFLRPVAACW